MPVQNPTWMGRRRTALSALPLAGALLILPNLIAWLPVSSLAAFVPGRLNIEFVALGICYLLWPSKLVLFALGLEVVCDLFEPVALMYYFSTTDALEALQYLGLIPFKRLLTYSAFVLAYAGILLAAVCWSCRKVRQVRIVSSVGAGLLCFASIYQLAQMHRVRMTDVSAAARPSQKLLRAPVVTLARRIIDLEQIGKSHQEMELASAMAAAFRLHGTEIAALRPNLALILVESWGEMLDSKARQFLTKAYDSSQIRSLYDIDSGVAPFHGATMNGESREFCGKIFGRGFDSASAQQLAACLPRRLSEAGYDTLGIDGFAPRMYGRMHWYPKLGFRTSLFAPDLALKGMRTCDGGLVGTCDTDVAEFIRTELLRHDQKNPLFVSWVSLNSHLPVRASKDRIKEANCPARPKPLQEEGVCVWAYLVERVHRSIASIAVEPNLKPTVFVLVGDHAPPFTSPARRALFSQQHVPYVILTPKALSAGTPSPSPPSHSKPAPAPA